MSVFVNMCIVGPLIAAVSFRRYHGDCPLLLDFVGYVVSIISFIRNNMYSEQALNQICGRHTVVRLPAGELQPDRIAQGVNDNMDFRRQATTAAADGLSFAPPFAPAECWCART